MYFTHIFVALGILNSFWGANCILSDPSVRLDVTGKHLKSFSSVHYETTDNTVDEATSLYWTWNIDLDNYFHHTR